jgi:hypothetical protein
MRSRSPSMASSLLPMTAKTSRSVCTGSEINWKHKKASYSQWSGFGIRVAVLFSLIESSIYRFGITSNSEKHRFIDVDLKKNLSNHQYRILKKISSAHQTQWDCNKTFLEPLYVITHCAAGFALLNLPKGKSLGRSKPETNSYAQAYATHCEGFLLYPSSAELPNAK